MTLFYLPLEPYQERYTWFMSCKHGWTETWFKEFGISFVRVEGMGGEGMISVGSVLDAFGRCSYSMSQVKQVIDLIQMGEVQDGDVIYVEDFWHPGIESLFYIRELTGIHFKVGCFVHAQSIDDTDFTHSMRDWMRPIEIGMSRGYDYVFTCSHILRRLAIEAGYNAEHVFKVGLPYNSQRLLQQLTDLGFKCRQKEQFVLFSSRFDSEKNPHFFLRLVERCKDIQFKLVKPRKHITNDLEVQKHLEDVLESCSNLELVDTSDKLAYYDLLARAKVQFNCAKQDWVSWTLLEAITFGCNPLYPNWKDFPYELRGFEGGHIYENENIEEADRKLRVLLEKPFDSAFACVVERHDRSWRDCLEIMEMLK